MTEEEEKTNYTKISEPEKPTIWQRLTAGRGSKRVPLPVKIGIGVLVMVILIIITFCLYNNVPVDVATGESLEPGVVIDFPDEWSVGWDIIKFIDTVIDWMVINWDPFFFDHTSSPVRSFLNCHTLPKLIYSASNNPWLREQRQHLLRNNTHLEINL